MPAPSRPIENCYWVVPGRFLAGEYPGDSDETMARDRIDAFVRAGVKAFIDLTEADEGLLPYAGFLDRYAPLGITHQRFSIVDVSVPGSATATAATLDAIDGHMAGGRLVYVHCWGGVGRTGVIVGCWLARHGHRGRAALSRLRELWRHCPKSARRTSPETIAQQQYIAAWIEPGDTRRWRAEP